jgi:hypothetical protein
MPFSLPSSGSAIVATLGTLAIYRGAVAVPMPAAADLSATVPDNYEGIARIHLAGVPLLAHGWR